MSPSSSTRWCPTPEQLMILEELYRRGVRTPNAPQIQKITAHLAFYGKIQGKNVFYWFQNHKARDRQKLRKKLAKQLNQQQLLQQHLYGQYQPSYHNNQTGQLFVNPSNNIVDFNNPSSGFPQFPITSCSPGNLLAQGTDESVINQQQQQTWMTDLPKDCLNMISYGHDSMMIMDVGPTLFPCCSTRNNNMRPPLQTLELFPLTSPSTATTSTAASEIN